MKRKLSSQLVELFEMRGHRHASDLENVLGKGDRHTVVCLLRSDDSQSSFKVSSVGCC